VSKATISKVFIGSAVAVVAFANGVFLMDGPDVVGVRGTPMAWTTMALAIVAGFVVIGGFVGGLVSWIGALLNTAQLDDKVWFLVLLLLGIWNLGVFAMIAYVIAGPDGTTVAARREAHAVT
jgi:hypothetical protein